MNDSSTILNCWDHHPNATGFCNLARACYLGDFRRVAHDHDCAHARAHARARGLAR